MTKVRIRWNPEIKEDIRKKITDRFNIDYHPTLNGINTVEISEEDWDVFVETMTYGHFSILKQ